MTRPLLPVLIAFLLGVWIESLRAAPLFPNAAALVLTSYGVLLTLALAAHIADSARAATLALIAAAFMIGVTRYAITDALPRHHISRLFRGGIATIEGYLCKPPEAFGKRKMLYIETAAIETAGQRYETTGRIRITLTEGTPPGFPEKPLEYGDVIRARLLLKTPQNRDEAFDYQAFLQRRGIYFLGALQSDRNVLKLPEKRGNALLRWLYGLQTMMRDALDRHAPYEPVFPPPLDSPRRAVQVIQAMTLGTGYVLTDDIRQTFRNSGMYHILVISGIHIVILAWGGHLALTWAGQTFRFRGAIISGLLLAYAGVTGFQYPVLRSVISAIVFYASILCNRAADSLYSLCFTIGLIVFIFPNALFEVSFLLTVAATAFILLVFRWIAAQTWRERLQASSRITREAANSMITTVGAMLGVSPLMIYYFGQPSLFSLISTPLSLPLVTVLLPLSLFVCFAALLPQAVWPVIQPFFAADIFLAQLLIKFSALFPAVNFTVPRPSPFLLVGYYALMVWFFTRTRRNRRTTRIIPPAAHDLGDLPDPPPDKNELF